MGDHYGTLGLGRDASKADIKNAFFRLAHRYHPDHHTHAGARAEAAARFRQAKEAYDVLSDERRRADYDRSFRSSSSTSSGHGQQGQGGNSSSSSSSGSSSSSSSSNGKRRRAGTSGSSSSTSSSGHKKGDTSGSSSSSSSSSDHGNRRRGGTSGSTTSSSSAKNRRRRRGTTSSASTGQGFLRPRAVVAVLVLGFSLLMSRKDKRDSDKK